MIACTTLRDEDLLLLLQQGHTPAFRELYLRYWNKLYYIAHRRLKSAPAAEEIVQDVFLTVWQRRVELTIDSLPEYLSAMTRHAVYHYMVREKKMDACKSDLRRGSEKTPALQGVMEHRMILESIKKFTNRLPEKCRLVFIYNKIDDKSLPEVAEELGISLKTAEAHLTKALRIVRENIPPH
jgi:RNA polymerase sigma-70 factor (ECF subfamily)